MDAPSFGELFPVSRDAMQGSYPEVATDFARISDIAYAEEEAFRGTLDPGHPPVRPGGQQGAVGVGQHAVRRPGVPAARHVRLPDRADPGDGRRAGTRGRRGRLPHPDAPSSGTGPRPTPGPRRAAGSTPRSTPGCGPRGRRRSPASRPWRVSQRSAASWSTASCARWRCPATRSRSCSTETPFYAESGGQSGDHGEIVTSDGLRLQVVDVQRPVKGLVVHKVTVGEGELRTGQTVQARGRRRLAARRLPGALGHPRDPRGAARDPRPDRAAGWLVQPARLHAARLPLEPRRDRGPEGQDRAALQRGDPGRPRRVRDPDAAGRGACVRGHRSVRRGLRRGGPRRRHGRRLVPGAVCRHPRRAVGPGRPAGAERGVLGRLRHPPGGGLRRAWRRSSTWPRSARW